MLQTIREHTQGWIAGTIVTIIILTFALWGIHSYFTGDANNSTVAEVNGVAITKEQLAVAYERVRRQAQSQYGTNLPKDEKTLKSRALQTLIDIEVARQASLAQGFYVSDRQVDNYLQSMPEFQVDGKFSLKRFNDILSATLLSTSEFLELIKTSLIIDQPKLGIIFTSFALPNETTYSIALVNQERNIDYLNIPLQYFLTKQINITKEQVTDYYKQHQNDFMTPEQVNVEYITLSLKDLAAAIQANDSVLQSFYNENINAYTNPMTWKLVAVSVPLAATATPEEVENAKTKAKALATALQNGQDINKLGKSNVILLNGQNWLSLNQVPPELQRAVTQLVKPGQLSDIVKTSQGLVIIKAVDIAEPKLASFLTVKDKVKEAYARQHAEEKFAELREQLANVAYEHPDSLQAAAKELNLPIQTSELFSRNKPGKDIAQHKKVREIAFSNDVLNSQNNSDVIQINPETVVVIRVKSHIPSALLPLNDIYQQIETKLKTKAAEDEAQKFADQLLADLRKGAVKPEDITTRYKFLWNSLDHVGRYSTKVDSAILDMAFQLPDPADNQNHVMYGATRTPNGYAIVALKSVKQGNIVDQKQATIFAEQVQNSDGLLEYELYKRSEDNHAKVNLFKS